MVIAIGPQPKMMDYSMPYHMGLIITPPDVLFTKIEDEQVTDWTEMFGGDTDSTTPVGSVYRTDGPVGMREHTARALLGRMGRYARRHGYREELKLDCCLSQPQPEPPG